MLGGKTLLPPAVSAGWTEAFLQNEVTIKDLY